MKSELKRTWSVFFGRFGRLTDVQSRAIPILLEGRSALVCSPTGSGKTEAVLAPLVERHVPAHTDGLRIVYVVPTRALVADLSRRLEPIAADMGVRVDAKTSDTPTISADQPHILLTTPESLDSLICRKPALFSQLKAVVLDELHLVDGTYRGDQLKVLLRRLPEYEQCIGMSATVHEPSGLVTEYLPSEAEIITAGEPRAISLRTVQSIEEATSILKQEKRHKALWFCNSRREVEELSLTLAEHWPRDRIVAHHGSLGRRERREAEEAMRRWKWGICVATMTLEIGVDIGDVSAAVLHRPPPTPSSFQQRLGRACRREREIFGIGVCRDSDDQSAFDVLVEMANSGLVEPRVGMSDLSVAVQQTFSILYGRPAGLTRDELGHYLAPLAERSVLEEIWQHLMELDWLETGRSGVIRATTQLMDKGEKGQVHGNIPKTRELRFMDASSGRELGSALTGVSLGDTVVIAGKARQVVGVKAGRIQVAQTSQTSGAGRALRFGKRNSGGAYRWLLPESLRD